MKPQSIEQFKALRKALKEVRQIRAGKRKGKTVEEFISQVENKKL